MAIGQFFIDLLNAVIRGIGAIIGAVLSLFPDTPFQRPKAAPDSVNLGYVTWIFDFPTWIQHLTLILTAIGLYYVVRIAARWIKLVRE